MAEACLGLTERDWDTESFLGSDMDLRWPRRPDAVEGGEWARWCDCCGSGGGVLLELLAMAMGLGPTKPEQTANRANAPPAERMALRPWPKKG